MSSGLLNNAACQLIRKTSGFTPGHVSLCVSVCVAEPSNGAVDVAWDSSLNDALEKEVQDTRKMVSALQVPECLRSLCFNPHNAEVVFQRSHLWTGLVEFSISKATCQVF